MGFAMCRLTMLHAVKSHVDLVLQEILDEVVRELHKVKDEIINGKQQQKSIQRGQTMSNLAPTSFTALIIKITFPPHT